MVERFTRTAAGHFNIARGQLATVQLAGGEAELRWGLLPPWQGHGGKRGPTIHVAPVDKVAATPFLRTACAKRRCLVLADGFYAWRKLARGKQAYWVHAPGQIALAGIAATNKDDGVASFAIITVPAAPLVVPFAHEMPAIVDARWLESAELVPLELASWRADAVSDHVDDVAHDDARCVAPLGNPAQGELF
ncbi:MAG: SOS response-associated peptidase family protein [Kofleriaceae bacterium]